MPQQRLILVGFGNVGRALSQLFLSLKGRLSALGFDPSVVAICTGRRGAIIDPAGIDLSTALTAREFPIRDLSAIDIIGSVQADTVLEMSPLSIRDGQPAISHIERALTSGKHVVTANKGPLAWHYEGLRDLARKHGKKFLFESTVMDGVPIFSLNRHSLRACQVTGFSGILNSTSNYVLTRMSLGLTMEQAVQEAQAGGFAEADPSLDLDGWDSAAKVAVLANVLMDARCTPDDVDRRGMAHLGQRDLSQAASRGNTIKLICRAEKDPLSLSVSPEEVPAGSHLGLISGTSSLLTIKTDLLGELTIVEQDPTIDQTAYGVLADLIEIGGL